MYKPEKVHYGTKEKAAIIASHVTGCTKEEALPIAMATEGFTFAMLKQLAKAITILSRGE